MDIPAGKRQKHCDRAQEDRISNLPDSILCHILSFLPTRCSIKTSILSRRWRFLWTSVPLLDLEDLSFQYLHKRQRTPSAWAKSFTKFANQVLALRSHPRVRKLRLHVSNSSAASHVASYISAAISRNVEEIDLSICQGTHLPQSLFSCGTLSVLKLRYSAIELDIVESVSVDMPNLKVLHIFYGSNWDSCGGSLKRLLCGSPILEELVIHRVCSVTVNDPDFSIVSSSLKTLEFRFEGRCYGNGSSDNNTLMVIDAPKLEFLYLMVKGYDIELKNTPSVLNASIITDESLCRGGIRKVPCDLWTIVNVRVLCLSMYMIQDPKVYELVHFANLKKLELRYCGQDDLSTLPQILKRLPCLEHLILRKYCCFQRRNAVEGLELEKSEIHCLIYSLKTLELGRLICHKEGMGILKYFMKNSSVLNEIRLTRYYGCEKQRGIPFLKKLLTFPRCSNAFRVIFLD